ncbi:polyphosphate kinase Ppk [Psychroflexus torquis ATCC 700755]|uniref:Polyphosphate kinase n=1 Tax=Psychroflexus torquis (strain ATCC 700755 / CIP 106069 / ACAM 623) TaxID=313595 RepID=K4IPD3_PSYTT|nr:polyphosphate kinase 1 [Psychroflexus torquis]AFU67385.1 polyphosphate kinase Ppk [Psychroflexus torquis ATCC 700755]
MHHNRYDNRELSWLKFNQRVLQEAADPSVPLIERLRFLGIFSNNLDEFFKVRYATVKRIDLAGKSGKKVLGGFNAGRLLKEITQIVIKNQAESLDILASIQHQLKDHDIFIIDETEVTLDQAEFLKEFFLEKVSPALVTIMLNDIDKVPNLTDLKAYLAVKMVQFQKDRLSNRYILIEIPSSVERFVVIPSDDGKKYVILLDDLIRFNLNVIFNIFDYTSISAHMIKITRDAELDLEGDLSKSYIEKLMDSVKDRLEGDPVRFLYDKEIEQDTLDFLLNKMEIETTDSLIPGGKYHNRRDYMNFPDLGATHLLYDRIVPLPIPGLEIQGSLLEKISKKDFLQYTPYQTFSYTVKFLREAALDPKVKSIKITIYRLASVSHIASSLINAVKNGKRVTVSIELQARFDEANNIKYAEKMEREGVKLIFGVTGLKVHCKTCIIERLENRKIKYYGFISTGNFNEKTAKVYTDYTLFTAHQGILKDIIKVFDFFEVNYKIKKYKHLIVSPHYTRTEFSILIDQEIQNQQEGKKSGISIKMNSLSDYGMIDKLYEASRAGVKIKLIIRGINCLIPQVSGMSDNIESISIVDKFLEHPRLYIFENDNNPVVFISSADWMTRNIDHRVEVTCPIYDNDIKQELIETFNISWKDNVKARDFSSNRENAYRPKSGPDFRSQFETYSYYKNKLQAAETK